MGRRPMPAVRDLTRDGRWSTYDVIVLKKMREKIRTDRSHRTPSKATITNKTRPAGSFSSLARRGALPARCSMYMSFLWLYPTLDNTVESV
jgi:hypothetical protein